MHNLTKTWSRHKGVKPPRLNQLFFTSRGRMMRRRRWRATLRIRSFQNRYFGSQSDLWPLNALNRAVATSSSSQSPTSFLMNSLTVPISISLFSPVTHESLLCFLRSKRGNFSFLQIDVVPLYSLLRDWAFRTVKDVSRNWAACNCRSR